MSHKEGLPLVMKTVLKMDLLNPFTWDPVSFNCIGGPIRYA